MSLNRVVHLYIHLPFCARRCGYCDFYSETSRLDLAPRYVGALLAELDEVADRLGGLRTVYLGGGTPTLLDAGLLEQLLTALAAWLDPGAEVTIEANPVTMNADMARRLRAAGVNRVSLGAQSFDPRLRRHLERAGEADAVAVAVDRLREAGFDNLGLDLIFGIPGQELSDLERDIEAALALASQHISYYELSTKDGSPYQRRWGAQLEAMAGRGRLFYETVVEALEAAGYRWYETSNFARPGRECRHNLALWQGEDYLGLGAGAWSTVGRQRWQNPDDLDIYLQPGDVRTRARRVEQLSERDKLLEKLALGLRTDRGVTWAQVEPVVDLSEQKLLLLNGFISDEDGRILLTRAGRFVANEVSARLFRA
ncbi:MAG: radical SAM family heme chaperone HemW [Thermoleophilia bacterium]